MNTITFILALHNHQPVGNFDNVFRDSYELCYKPFIDVLEEFPSIKVVLHYTGPLLEWIEEHDPLFFDKLSTLTKRKQIEFLSGGFYEPILTLVPDADALGQIRMMNEYIKRKLLYTPKGFWLTERVWEPTFPRIAAQTGLNFTSLDDSHFLYAGLENEEIRDFYVTEDGGYTLNIFPISKYLRYSIPFQMPGKVIEYFQQFAGKYPNSVITLADDGEKFGVWPGTHNWVYREKWLYNFFKALEENSSWIKTATYSEVLASRNPRGKIYLPTASYEEMMEWALPSRQVNRLEDLKKRLEQCNLTEQAHDFVRGGFFRNFFIKYDESANMKNKLFYVSRKVHAMKGGKASAKKEALRELWKGQCNCPYWHGVFGGLYLHHLRRSTYEHLIRAENIADDEMNKLTELATIVTNDVNCDGVNELLFESTILNVYCDPYCGGTIFEIDYRPGCCNITDTMTRREEAYHRRILQHSNGSQGENSGGGGSIHDLKKDPSPEILRNLVYDKQQKRSLMDRFLPNGLSFEQFIKNEYEDLGVFSEREYNNKINKTKRVLELTGDGTFVSGQQQCDITVKKSIKVVENKLEITYVLTNLGKEAFDGTFGIEWNFNFKSNDAKAGELSEWKLFDEWSTLGVVFTADVMFDCWQYQIKTVSQTESEYSLNYQGTCLFPHWHVDLQPLKDMTIGMQLEVVER